MQYKLFGCKVNKYYLNQWLNYLPDDNNSIIIASCEVTDRAKKKYIKEIITHSKNGKKVLVTGCGTIVNRQKINEKAFYHRYPELRPRQDNITLLPESPQEKTATEKFPLHNTTRKAIIIQTGCDNYCSFCLSIRKRGKHISRPTHEIIDEINSFQQSGGKEIVLTGINLAARGCQNSTNPKQSKLHHLLQKIIQDTNIPRIRISSLGPEYLHDEFFKIIQNPRFMTHFHISIQSFSDNVLTNMKRNYNSQQLDMILNNFKKLNKYSKIPISLGADIITGFPGETEKDFQITYEAIKTYNITKLHAFPFSPHQKGETVPASSLPGQISTETRMLRNKKLITQGNKIRQTFIKTQKGSSFKVLLEQKKDNFRHGWTENYIEVKIDANHGKYENNQIIQYIL